MHAYVGDHCLMFWQPCNRSSIKVAIVLRRMSLSQSQVSQTEKQWFYAVGKGRQVGVYMSWPECKKQVENIANARFRKFQTQKEAVAFIQECKEKYSPYKSPTNTQFLKDTVNLPSVPSSLTQPFSSTQPLESIQIDNLSHSHKKSASSSKAISTPERSNRTAIVPEENTRTRLNSDRLSPQTLSALECLAEEDPFSLEQTEQNVHNGVLRESGVGSDNILMRKILETVEKYFSEIKATLNNVVLKVNDIESKVQELSSQIVDRNSSLGTSGSSGLGVKRTLRETYNIPQPVGSRHLSTSKPDEEVEVVPVPPKKIPKIELDSDDEVDGFSYDFKVDGDGYVIVYTDGACERNGKFGAKAGIGVWFGDSHPLNCSEPVLGRATNNTAEIQAAVQAVEIAKRAGVRKVLIHTDSEFLINCVTKWMNKWMKNSWKLASGGHVKNKEDLILLNDAMQGIDVKWQHVRGHQGIHGNEMADRLARNGAERYKP